MNESIHIHIKRLPEMPRVRPGWHPKTTPRDKSCTPSANSKVGEQTRPNTAESELLQVQRAHRINISPYLLLQSSSGRHFVELADFAGALSWGQKERDTCA